MQLTRFTDYSLRVLIAVGVNEPNAVTIGEISGKYGISKNHLMKVVQQLSHAGYLRCVRGRGGGLRLAVDPGLINLGAVVREVEKGFTIVPCFAQDQGVGCRIVAACKLKGVLNQALAAFLAVLDACTLADLLVPRSRLRELLDFGSAGAAVEAR